MKNIGERTKSGKIWQWVFVLFLCLGCSLALAAEAKKEVNTIRSIKTVAVAAARANSRTQPEIEIELNSTREFPVRNQIVVLRIGDEEFTRSRSPEDGSLNTLIFILPADQFTKAANGDPVAVYYGRDDPNERDDQKDRWEFGRLDKSLLDKK
jgi:hypothetical protein